MRRPREEGFILYRGYPRCIVALLLFVRVQTIKVPGAGTRGPPKEQHVFRPCRSGHLPTNGRVAVLLRGQVFREGLRYGESCKDEALENQQLATQSLVDKIVEPLEQRKNIVDIVFTYSSCHLWKTIKEKLGERRVLGAYSLDSDGQKANLAESLLFYHEVLGNETAVAAKYDLILITRHDMVWESPISEWSADFCRFNFASRCEASSPHGADCVSDVLHTMPGRLAGSWESLLGCFTADGHDCLGPMVKALGRRHVGYATDWRPKESVRDENSWGRPYGQQHHGGRP
mmetsp:Transcript_48478/g.109124  ORF Transcript_48478/g.109124 Transcript_48478/m.109124 type:complete len:288 (-) Transcript_48478:53-916(-)